MSLSPVKHRQITRQRSSPSLAQVGLPPPLPSFNEMLPSSSSRSLKRSRSKHRIHRGDVSSSATSSPYGSDDEDFTSTTPTKRVTAVPTPETTPKRKVVGAMDPMTAPRAKKMTLQERLQAASHANAKMKKSRSIGEGLDRHDEIPPVPSLPSSTSFASPTKSKMASTMSLASVASMAEGERRDRNDKVVVCVRIKPTSSSFANSAYDLTETSLSLSNAHPNVQKRGGKAGREEEYTYTFDKLLQYPETTPALYTTKIAPLVGKAMNGFNSTIFAYGQTGSGKSFTMTGTQSELGIIPCAVDGVFDAINADPNRAFLLRVSYIEIYNETLRDLLNFKKGPLRDDEKPAIHTGKGKVYVDPLVEEVVSTPEDVVNLLEKGNLGRKVGATDWNDRSSRSHCVFTIVIESRPRDGDAGDDVRLSRLNLIDLAGSERAVSDLERRGEGKHINKSLLALREVINKLTDKKRMHVPYRDSKLTHLLENALGGDSNICVICTLSAEEEHCSETLETLKFAGRCSQVETRAKKNVLLSDDRALIKAKDKEIEVLKRRLKLLANGGTMSTADTSSEQVSDLAESVAIMEARKSKLVAQLAKLNGEILTSEIIPRSATGLPVASPKPKRRRISDFHFMGMGTPKKGGVSERRTVSNMTRVTEDEMPSMGSTMDTAENLSKAFNNDRALAALRRLLARREAELEAAQQELADAVARLTAVADQEAEATRLGGDVEDMRAQLETTRSEFASKIDEKESRINQLENAILELRKSREDLAIEDQQRYDEVKAQLDAMASEKLQLQADIGKAQDARKEADEQLDSLGAELNSHRASTQKRVEELEVQLAETTSRHEDVLRSRDDAASRLSALSSSCDAARNELEASKKSHYDLNQQVQQLRAEVDTADRARQNALRDLESYQQAAMSNENDTINGLRREIDHMRHDKEEVAKWHGGEMHSVREEARAAWEERDRRIKEAEEARNRTAELERQVGDVDGRGRAAQEEIERLKADLAQVRTDLASAQHQSENRAQALSASEEEVGAHRKRADEAETGLADVSRAMKIKSDREQQLKAEIDTITADNEKRMSAERHAAAKIKAELAKESARASEAEAALATLRHSEHKSSARERQLLGELEAAKQCTATTLGEAEARRITEAQVHDGKVKSLESAVESLTRELELSQRSQGHSTTREWELQQELETFKQNANAEAETLREAQKTATEEHSATIFGLEAEIAKLKEAAEAERQRSAEALANLRTSSQRDIDDVQAKLAAALSGADDATKLSKELQDTMAKMQQEHVTREQRLVSDLNALTQDIDKARNRHAEAMKELKVSEQRALASEGRLGQLDKSSGESLAKETALREDLKQEKAKTAALEQSLASLQERLSVADQRILVIQEESAATKKSSETLRVEVNRLTSALSDHERQREHLAASTRARETARDQFEQRASAAEESVTKQAEFIASLEIDCAALRQALETAQRELGESQKTASESSSKSTELALEIAELRSISRARHAVSASDPSVPVNRGLAHLRAEALTASLTGDQAHSASSKLSAALEEEIDRLEKVVEAQKVIIDTQKEKMRMWEKRIEEQDALVNALTLSGSSPEHKQSRRISHGRSKSVKVESPRVAASPAPKKPFPSTFTAFNLAMPTTPTPLPSHGSQYDNASAKKGRRVTIDHDMHRLTDSNKVNQVKAMFDQPDAAPTTPTKTQVRREITRTPVMSSVPRQRRP